jgi:hypothetical protein
MNWDLDIEGWMSTHELEWLHNVSSGMNSVVEIGLWLGRSTFALCSGCKGKVYAIDHFKGSLEHQDLHGIIEIYPEFVNNMKPFKNIEIFKMDSKEASTNKAIPNKVDMIFIDGSHEYEDIKFDLEEWEPRATKLICGHDAHENGVPKILREYFKGQRIEFIPKTCIWMVRR